MELSARQTPYHLIFLISILIIQHFSPVNSIGVNYGTLGDNLPPPAQVAAFIKDRTIIDRVKIFDTNPDILRAFANTGISVTVTVPNGEVPGLANPRIARRWVATHIKPFYPQTKINFILMGSELLHWGDNNMISHLVPAMQMLHHALVLAGMRDVKVTTAHSLGILASSFPPSAGRFRPGLDRQVIAPMLKFLRETRSPFMVNPYPYFGYNPKDANFVLFRGNRGKRDRFTGKVYTNMYDSLMDSVFSAMKSLGYGDVNIAVGETGWPSMGEPWLTHCTIENARWHNLNVFRKAISGVGTPLMPRRRFETYIFALFNENQKPGSLAEKNFGLFRPDFSPVYDIGIMRGGQGGVTPRPTPVPVAGKKWCVPRAEASDAALQANIDYACSKGLDCRPIQAGGACFNPVNVRSHASYIMNTFYQTNGRHDYNCDFAHTGVLTTVNPSYGACRFI
ncbi:hypothetical protein F0562_026148 [Nyssa sinensis]|uniref:glucan endo-1,3-beta-D-glucosidase n=1 Tax=Nyssa sinensis TaxID=561372 RepID=A0A5J5BAP6_9ASTE|nr:hypothetical protein F0562_026148 [Nyssa sinensis]